MLDRVHNILPTSLKRQGKGNAQRQPKEPFISRTPHKNFQSLSRTQKYFFSHETFAFYDQNDWHPNNPSNLQPYLQRNQMKSYNPSYKLMMKMFAQRIFQWCLVIQNLNKGFTASSLVPPGLSHKMNRRRIPIPTSLIN